MATEALIVWVHPFNDGNGRTSRFMGKFIEDGTVDTQQLVDETTSNNSRQRVYGESYRIDQYNIVKDVDIMWDDGELEELERTTGMPVSEGIFKSIERILTNKDIQNRIEAHALKLQKMREDFIAERPVA